VEALDNVIPSHVVILDNKGYKRQKGTNDKRAQTTI